MAKAKPGRHPNSAKTQFQPGNPGGVVNATTKARRAYRAAFDNLINAPGEFVKALKDDPKDTIAQRLAKVTVRDALLGNDSDKVTIAARGQIKDLFAHRPAQGVYVSDEEGNDKGPPADLGAIVSRLADLGVTLPAALVPREDGKA